MDRNAEGKRKNGRFRQGAAYRPNFANAKFGVKIWVGSWALLFLSSSLLTAELHFEFPKGSLEEALFEDASDGHLDRLSLEQAALIASGISQEELPQALQKIDSLYNNIALHWPMKRLTALQKGQVILHFLHQTTLHTYHTNTTEIQRAFEDGTYNCVSATLLFNILCERFKVHTAGVEVPTHIYSILLDPNSDPPVRLRSPQAGFEVQTTTPQGFLTTDFSRNEFLYAPRIQTWKGKRQVSEVALIAAIYYNRGIYWVRQKNYSRALPFYLKAFALDPDFPDLAILVQDLYTGWGNQFFEQGNYRKAIQIYEKGLSFSSPRNKPSPWALTQNLTAALINEANLQIKQKKWSEAQALLKKALNLGPFRETIQHNQRVLSYAWAQEKNESKKFTDH